MSRFLSLLVAVAGLRCAGADYAGFVNPLIGTSDAGNAFPGACMPFGMVQPSPDTGHDNTRPSGFDYRDGAIRCFSQTHLNGTGGGAGGDGALMPFVGKICGIDFSSGYDKATLVATPGYFRCRLLRYGITVEATAALRTAWYRIAYPSDSAAKVLVDTSAFIGRGCLVKSGPIVRTCDERFADNRREIRCVREVTMWDGLCKVAFVYRFSRPWVSIERLASDRFLGKGARHALDFGCLEDPLEVQVSVSYVSDEGAARNLAADVDGQSFESVRAANRSAWNDILGRLTVDGCSDDLRRNWYSSVYRLCIQPNLHTDVGEGELYTTFSLWDTFRAAHPLYTLLVPDKVSVFMKSLWVFGCRHGHLPIWLLYGREVHDMIGVHSIPVLVDAYEKGWRPAPGEKMLDFMLESLTGAEKECPSIAFSQIFDYGYIPCTPGPFCPKHIPGGSVSRTLELSYDWWCVARFARELGNVATAERAEKFAASWRNLYDATTGFMRARTDNLEHDGEWRDPFDPLENCQTTGFWGDYTEANASVYTWHVFQEPESLIEMMGGRTAAVRALNRFFATQPKPGKIAVGNNDEGGVIRTGQIGQYWQGNEPSHHIAYFYTVLGEPERCADIVGELCRVAYLPTPDGLCGNDDCGQMSAWYLFSSMGFYPFNPCGGEYVIGAPQVPKVTLKLANGKTFAIVAKNLSRENRYVKSATLNGNPIADWRVRHIDIITVGGELVFEMCAKNQLKGTSPVKCL